MLRRHRQKRLKIERPLPKYGRGLFMFGKRRDPFRSTVGVSSYTVNDKPGSVVVSHLSKRHTRRQGEAALFAFLFCLAPVGVCNAQPIAGLPVVSCTAISPLPLAGRYIFCCAVLGVTPTRVSRATRFLEPGLSSSRKISCLRLTHSRSLVPTYRILPQISQRISSSASPPLSALRRRNNVFWESLTWQ
jgi:hypothetical protein